MQQGPRDDLLGCLAEAVRAVTVTHPVRVAVDGAPASGKTTLADDLADVLRAGDRPVIRATIDDFLVPRAVRYRRGEFSAAGCYYDAHDHDALNRVLLDPLGPGGDRRFRPAPSSAVATAGAGDVLIVDGVFLLRPELADRWELRFLVQAAPEEMIERAVRRERAVSSRPDVERRWRERYLPAQQLYVAAVGPAERADVIVHNDAPQRPAWDTRAR